MAFLFFLIIFCATGFVSATPPTTSASDLMARSDDALRLLVTWADARQQTVLKDGRALTAKERTLAKRLGVLHPERVRVLGVDLILTPEDPFLAAFPAATSLNQPTNAAQTLQYAILIRNAQLDDATILAHELTHVAQYERLGGLSGFLTQYLHEIETVGYDASPLEHEACLAENLLKRLN